MLFALAQSLLLPRSEDLRLLKAAFAVDDGEARAAFAAWRGAISLDDVNWEEQKVLARLADALDRVSPGDPDANRIRGVAKAQWVQTQVMLRESVGAIDALVAAGVPVMVLKGAALSATGEPGGGPRLCSDLDVMVPRARFAEAIERALAIGWRSARSSHFARIAERFGAGLNLKKAGRGDIDIHHQPVGQVRLPDEAIDRLWRRSVAGSFLGRAVARPSTADMIAITASHAIQRLPHADVSLAWMFDMAFLLVRRDYDGAALVEACDDLCARAATRIALTIARDLLPCSRDLDAMIARLPARDIPLAETLRLVAGSSAIRHFKSLARGIASVASSASERFEEEAAVVRRVRNRLLPGAGPIKVERAERPDVSRSHRLRLQRPAGTSRLELTLEIPPGDRRRQYLFDLSIDRTAIARLSGRPIFRRSDKAALLKFSVPLLHPTQEAIDLEIEALDSIVRGGEKDPTILPAKPTITFRPTKIAFR